MWGEKKSCEQKYRHNSVSVKSHFLSVSIYLSVHKNEEGRIQVCGWKEEGVAIKSSSQGQRESGKWLAVSLSRERRLVEEIFSLGGLAR